MRKVSNLKNALKKIRVLVGVKKKKSQISALLRTTTTEKFETLLGTKTLLSMEHLPTKYLSLTPCGCGGLKGQTSKLWDLCPPQPQGVRWRY